MATTTVAEYGYGSEAQLALSDRYITYLRVIITLVGNKRVIDEDSR